MFERVNEWMDGWISRHERYYKFIENTACIMYYQERNRTVSGKRYYAIEMRGISEKANCSFSAKNQIRIRHKKCLSS